MNTFKQIFNYDMVPPQWKLCFNTECPLSQQCLRFTVGELSPKSITSGPAVYPAAFQNKPQCQYFKEIRIVNMAYGFSPLFREVKVKDAPRLRRKMNEYLGSRSYYYRYNNGEYLLTPEQQEWIIDLFRSFGYTEGLEFEGYRKKIDFS